MEPIKFDWPSGFGTKTEQACHYRQDRQVNKQYPGDNDRLAKFLYKILWTNFTGPMLPFSYL